MSVDVFKTGFMAARSVNNQNRSTPANDKTDVDAESRLQSLGGKSKFIAAVGFDRQGDLTIFG